MVFAPLRVSVVMASDGLVVTILASSGCNFCLMKTSQDAWPPPPQGQH